MLAFDELLYIQLQNSNGTFHNVLPDRRSYVTQKWSCNSCPSVLTRRSDGQQLWDWEDLKRYQKRKLLGNMGKDPWAWNSRGKCGVCKTECDRRHRGRMWRHSSGARHALRSSTVGPRATATATPAAAAAPQSRLSFSSGLPCCNASSHVSFISHRIVT